MDAGREAQQNRADVEMGLKTISDHYEELGADFGEELERRARDAKMIIETARKAELRLYKKFTRMVMRGKKTTVAATAVARELAGFVWAIGRI